MLAATASCRSLSVGGIALMLANRISRVDARRPLAAGHGAASHRSPMVLEVVLAGGRAAVDVDERETTTSRRDPKPDRSRV
jgi:hypothetical protein